MEPNGDRGVCPAQPGPRSKLCNWQVRNTQSASGTFALVARSTRAFKENTSMDKDRIAGAAKQAKGAIKEAAGKVTGDSKTQAEGKAEKAEGKVQNAIGGAKDAIREAVKQD